MVAERPQGYGPFGAVVEWLAGRGWRPRLLVWDAADVGERLRRLAPLREVEQINRWRLPQRLGSWGWRGAMRRLRNLRVRWWWARSGRPTATWACGPLRPEMVHYLPPGTRPVVGDLGALVPAAAVAGAVHGPSPDVVRGLPGVVLEPEAGGPLGEADVVAVPGHPRRDAARARLGLDPDVVVVGAWGPSALAPLVGADAFLRTIWSLRERRADLAVRALWFGGDERSRAWFPVVHQVAHLGLDGVVRLHPEHDLADDLALVLDVLVLSHAGRARSWPADHVRAAAVPVVRFDQAEVAPGEGEGDRTVAFPDVAALADGVGRAIDGRSAHQVAVRRRLEALEARLGGRPDAADEAGG